MTIKFNIELNPRDQKRARLTIDCKRGYQGICRFSIWTGEAGGTMWHWNGDLLKPSISPSIACQACDKHFVVSNGVAT